MNRCLRLTKWDSALVSCCLSCLQHRLCKQTARWCTRGAVHCHTQHSCTPADASLSFLSLLPPTTPTQIQSLIWRAVVEDEIFKDFQPTLMICIAAGGCANQPQDGAHVALTPNAQATTATSVSAAAAVAATGLCLHACCAAASSTSWDTKCPSRPSGCRWVLKLVRRSCTAVKPSMIVVSCGSTLVADLLLLPPRPATPLLPDPHTAV